jgi:hypothetical protein
MGSPETTCWALLRDAAWSLAAREEFAGRYTPLVRLLLLCQLRRNPLRHAHELTRQQLLGRFEPEPVTDPAMDLG